MAKQIYTAQDGEWVRVNRRVREICCDCGLVHDIDFRLINGHIEFRATRHPRATAAARRKFNFSKEE